MLIKLLKKIWRREHAKPVCGVGVLHTGMGDKLQEACGNHDLAYTIHRKDDSRKEADKRFLYGMKHIVAAGEYNILMKLSLTFKAYAYYGLVRSLGWLAW